jgi:hypothetical protein
VRTVLGSIMLTVGLGAIVLVYIGQYWLSTSHPSESRSVSAAFYAIAFLVSAGCLVHFSRRPAHMTAKAARNEPFRRAARLFSVAGLLIFGGLAVVMDLGTAEWPSWLAVVVGAAIAVGVLLVWRARRDTLRAADSLPLGRHAAPIRASSASQRIADVLRPSGRSGL